AAGRGRQQPARLLLRRRPGGDRAGFHAAPGGQPGESVPVLLRRHQPPGAARRVLAVAAGAGRPQLPPAAAARPGAPGQRRRPGRGDLIFEYEFVLPGKTINPLTGSFLQQNSIGGLSNSPQRVPRGFMWLDQVREVEGLIRTTLLGQLEEALDAPTSADRDAP